MLSNITILAKQTERTTRQTSPFCQLDLKDIPVKQDSYSQISQNCKVFDAPIPLCYIKLNKKMEKSYFVKLLYKVQALY